jgi:hypothetical protein
MLDLFLFLRLNGYTKRAARFSLVQGPEKGLATWSYVHNLSLHFCKRLFLVLESMTSWSQGNSFTAAPGLPFLREIYTKQKSYYIKNPDSNGFWLPFSRTEFNGGGRGTKMNLLAPVRNFHFLYIDCTEVTVMGSSESNTQIHVNNAIQWKWLGI